MDLSGLIAANFPSNGSKFSSASLVTAQSALTVPELRVYQPSPIPSSKSLDAGIDA